MMLRLVLVGMVAALGVTIPGGTNRGGWLVSAGRWANSAVVDWDTWRPDSVAGQSRRIVTTRHGCEQCRLARAAIALREQAAAASAVAEATKSRAVPTGAGSEKPTAEMHDVLPVRSLSAPTLAFEPIAVGDVFYTGVSFELNRIADGINVVQSPTVPSATLPRSQPIALADGLEPELPEVLCGVPDEDAADWAPIAVASQPRGENEPRGGSTLISSESGDDFEPDETDATPILDHVAPPIVAISTPTAASTYGPELFDVIACRIGTFDQDDAPDYDEAPSRAAVDDVSKSSVVSEPAAPLISVTPAFVAEPTSRTHNRVAGIPWPVFAPVDMIDQPPTRVVQESTVPWPVFAPIDHPTGGNKAAVVSGSSASLPRPGSSSKASWGQAVDLTCQAMCAWMGVLVGSAPVEITAR